MKPTLMDSNPAMATRRKVSNNHRERLSEWAPRTGDATVRTYGNTNRMKLAEMSNSFQKIERVTSADVSFDANADASNNIGSTN